MDTVNSEQKVGQQFAISHNPAVMVNLFKYSFHSHRKEHRECSITLSDFSVDIHMTYIVEKPNISFTYSMFGGHLYPLMPTYAGCTPSLSKVFMTAVDSTESNDLR